MSKIGIISLGCPRNLVDSERLLSKLKEEGNEIVDIEKAEEAIVNTCSFIEEATAESLDTIFDLIALKKEIDETGRSVMEALNPRREGIDTIGYL